MKKTVNLGLVAALVAALTLTGACANIANDRTRTQTEGTLAGAGIGAVLGAAIGAAIGGREGAWKGAAIGAGVGALGGLAVGTSVANKKADYANEEAWLAACLAEAQSVNQQAAAHNSRLKASLASYKKAGGSSGYSFAGGGTDEKQQAQAIKKELKQNGEMLALLDYQISSQEQVIASTGSNAQTKQLQKQVNDLKKQKQTLEQSNRELASVSNRFAM